ncbi:MAG: extracellular solute-binding protein, partial [Propionibacteriaceae bacterium]|nr:extracellular solute-binding protein [Propionibacteriaceae bacterium]
MKKTRFGPLAALALAAALSLSACGDSGDSGSGSGSDEPAGPVTLTLSGWSFKTTPEFQVLVDAFEADNSDVEIKLKEYDANDYETLMLADIASGTATDIITI